MLRRPIYIQAQYVSNWINWESCFEVGFWDQLKFGAYRQSANNLRKSSLSFNTTVLPFLVFTR
jgi:hypothetical protein